jgi:hypothetical protein
MYACSTVTLNFTRLGTVVYALYLAYNTEHRYNIGTISFHFSKTCYNNGKNMDPPQNFAKRHVVLLILWN